MNPTPKTVTIELTRAELEPIIASMNTMTQTFNESPGALMVLDVLGFRNGYDGACKKLNDAYNRLG